MGKDKEDAYNFICICKSLFSDEEDDEDEDNEESKKANDKDKAKCNGGVKCMCTKPATDPDYPWVISKAGYFKYSLQMDHAGIRCPDNFGMYTFNDHEGYGMVQVWQNLLLDYSEASVEKNWKEQWAVCETFGMLARDVGSSPLCTIDDSQGLKELVHIVGTMFLSMLARLEALGQLGPATQSAVRNLDTMMAMYLQLASSVRSMGVMEDTVVKTNKKTAKKFKYDRKRFDGYIVAYTKRHGITIRGPADIGEMATGRDMAVAELPPALADGADAWKVDPFGFKIALQKYAANNGFPFLGSQNAAQKKNLIGGDSLDITSWTSAKWKKASFNGKDPLGKKEIDAIKQGIALSIR